MHLLQQYDFALHLTTSSGGGVGMEVGAPYYELWYDTAVF